MKNRKFPERWCVMDGSSELWANMPTRELARECMRRVNEKLPGLAPFTVVKYVPVTRKGGGA